MQVEWKTYQYGLNEIEDTTEKTNREVLEHRRGEQSAVKVKAKV